MLVLALPAPPLTTTTITNTNTITITTTTTTTITLSGGNCTARTNDAVINLRSPVYDVTLRQTHSHLTFSNIDVDGHVGRFIGVEG